MKPPLIGRDGPLGELTALLSHAKAGRGSAVVVLGDAGIGKSALARALASDAESAGFAVTVGRAWEFTEAPPYLPLWPCLRSLGLPVPAGDGASLEGAFHFWERVVQALAQQSAAKPILWILEDLHAADQQTLDLCCFLSEPLRGLRVLLVGASRSRDARLEPHVDQRLLRLRRNAVEIVLEPLGAQEVAVLAEQYTRHRLAPESRRRLVELTGGNPLFVVECAKALRLSGAARLGTLPPSVRQLALEQLELLPETTRAVVASGAVVGRDFSAAMVGRMSKMMPARVIDRLAPALRSGLLDEKQPGEFCFHHVLFRDAVYDGLSVERRAEEHHRAELALAGMAGDGALVERAHHALCALVPGCESDALALAEEASRQLEAEGAFDRALALDQRCLAVRRALGLIAPVERELRTAELAFSAGRFSDGRGLCDALLARARAAGDAILLARAALILGAGLRPANIDEVLVRALKESLAGLPAHETALRLRVRARLAAAVQPAPNPLVPVEEARETIAEAIAHGDDQVLCDVLFFGGSAMVDYAPITERMTHARRLSEVATRSRNRARTLAAYYRLVFDELQAGQLAAFERDADDMLALARELGHPRYLWRALLMQSMRALAHGRFEESDRLVVEVEHLAALTDEPALLDTLRVHQLMRLRTLHRDAELGAVSQMTLAQVNHFPEVMPAFIVMHTTFFGDRDETERLLGPARQILGLIHHEPVGWTGLGEMLAFAGTAEEQRQFLALLQPHAGEHAITGHLSLTYEGPVARTIGLLHASLGERDLAERALRQALEQARRADFRPWVARTAWELAQLLEGTAAAQSLRDEAGQLADEIGMPWLSAQLRAPMAEPAAVSPRMASPPQLLLARRGELWDICVDGQVVRVRDSRGVQLLARLVARPDEELHVLALASDEAGALLDSDAGEVIDAQAARAYRERLRRLDGELVEAEGAADRGRVASLHGERQLLERELAAAVGLSGRLRRTGSASERARINVQRRLRDAIRRIGEVDAALGRYLERAVRTGTYCSFRP